MTNLLQQVVELANAARFEFAVLPPSNPDTEDWFNAGERIFSVMNGTSKDAKQAMKDITAMESLVAALDRDQKEVTKVLEDWRLDLEKRSK